MGCRRTASLTFGAIIGSLITAILLITYASYLFGPYLSQPTAWRSITEIDVSSAGIYDQAVTHSLSVSYDGFSVFYEGSPSNTVTGLLTVFGFNQ